MSAIGRFGGIHCLLCVMAGATITGACGRAAVDGSNRSATYPTGRDTGDWRSERPEREWQVDRSGIRERRAVVVREQPSFKTIWATKVPGQ